MKRSIPVLIVCAGLLFSGVARSATGDATLPLCPESVHARYMADGPDGEYPTWHPLIDLRYHCHFDHDHGSNPALLAPVSFQQVGILPLYGYTALKHGMAEPHAGFKTMVFTAGGVRWMLTAHLGTANPLAAACVRMHTVDLVGVDAAGQLVVDMHVMGDFGKATTNDFPSLAPLTPPSCPNQAAVGDSSGGREFPIASGSNASYEPWRLDGSTLPAIGFNSGNLVLNTIDPIAACNSVNCTANVARDGAIGALRLVTLNDGFSISGAISGTFYTDPMGRDTRASTDADAVRQYIKPGFAVDLPGAMPHCRPASAWDEPYWCTTVLIDEMQLRTNSLISGAN